ncbi:hypothetical protein ACFODZ_09365 [Marinicella sediminis]|uniref:DUF11 domain-containing protein n=1 Tax=Marinicella sediminis TaxID=1792834 RepID=A0ABV7J8I9_9GAMM|nr:hypothetical protein [Marinicella sediminis]
MNQIYHNAGKALLFSGLLMLTPPVFAVSLSMNNSDPVGLSDDVNLDTIGDTFELKIEEPILCHTTLSSLPTNEIIANVVNPNNGGKQVPLLSNVRYGILSQLLSVEINNPKSACVTESKISYGDVIWRDDFTSFDLSYTNLPSQIVRGQDVDYSIHYENKYDFPVKVELIEYASEISLQNAAFFEAPSIWECVNHNGSTVICDEDNVPNVVSNMNLAQGTSAQIDVTRTVDSRSDFGENVQLMAVAFVIDESDDIIDTYVVNHTAQVVENSAPSINWLNQPSVSFTEDETQPLSLTFIIDDQTGARVDVPYLQQAISAANNKVQISNIVVFENQFDNYEVTFDVLPAPDAFTTQGNTEQINIIIEDQFGEFSNPLSTDVDITPVNDAPSFSVTCDHIVLNPTPRQGEQAVSCASQINSGRANWEYSDWLQNPTAGPGEDDQSMFYSFLNVSDPNQILDQQFIVNISPNMLLDDLLILTNPGASGLATFELQAMDNGGLQGNGCNDTQVGDGCDTFLYGQTLTVELLPSTYLISGMVNDLNPQDAIFVRLYDNSGASPVFLRNLPVNGNAQGGPEGFTFDQDPLLDGFEYHLETLGGDCEFDDGQGVRTLDFQGTINGADVSDILIFCNVP